MEMVAVVEDREVVMRLAMTKSPTWKCGSNH